MPSLFRHRDCVVCGGVHNFCLPFGDVITGQRFSFRCPDQDRQGDLRASGRWERSHFYPQGAVALERLDAARARRPRTGP